MKPAAISIAVGFVICSSAAVSEPEPTTSVKEWLGSVDVPELNPPATWDAWMRQRSEIRATLRALLGDFPPRPPIP